MDLDRQGLAFVRVMDHSFPFDTRCDYSAQPRPFFILACVLEGAVDFVEDGHVCHVEKGETEEETAVRETVEETSVVPRLLQGFRREHGYELKNGNSKTVTYFVGEFGTENPRKNGDFEDFEYLLLPFNEAIRALTFENTKELLTEADEFIGVRVNP